MGVLNEQKADVDIVKEPTHGVTNAKGKRPRGENVQENVRESEGQPVAKKSKKGGPQRKESKQLKPPKTKPEDFLAVGRCRFLGGTRTPMMRTTR